jgi:hypothetical protein
MDQFGRNWGKAGESQLILVPPSTPKDEDVWPQVFEHITLMPRTDCKFAKALSNHRTLILAEVIRLRWNSKFRIKGVPRTLKKSLELIGSVTNTLLSLINEVFLRYPCGYEHPAFWFAQVFLENEAIGVYATTDEEFTKSQYVANFRNANQKLWTLESNPFLQPATKALFDIALLMAEQYNGFTPHLKAYVKARRRLSTHLKTEADMLRKSGSGGAKVSTQGRKKQEQKKSCS